MDKSYRESRNKGQRKRKAPLKVSTTVCLQDQRAAHTFSSFQKARNQMTASHKKNLWHCLFHDTNHTGCSAGTDKKYWSIAQSRKHPWAYYQVREVYRCLNILIVHGHN